MTLRLVYRLYGGQNRKNRPDYFDKGTCLASFLVAARTADAEAVVLADGPLPAPWRELAERGARVIDIPGGPVGLRGSYWSALRLPDRLGWPDDDVVYFCEDDYLHRPEAFVALRSATESIPAAGYFALYASTPDNPTADGSTPWGWRPAPDAMVDGQRWVNVPSTTSTHGVRLGALRADLGIIRQGMIPYPERFLDHEILMVCQGALPYSPAEIVLGRAATRFRTGYRAVAANCVLTPFRLAFELRALTRRRQPHLLYASDPNLACHLETPMLAPQVDWPAVARDGEAAMQAALADA